MRITAIFSVVIFLVGCIEEATGRDCSYVRQDVIAFAEMSIFPLVDSESPPKLEPSVIEQLKQLREEVATCDLPDADSNATEWTEWDEQNFIRLNSWLSPIEVTLELALETDDPETTRMLINSTAFGEMVANLQAALDRRL